MATRKADEPRRLTKEEIWAADDIVETDVLVPQWHGVVRIKTFSKKQVSQIQRDATRRNPRTQKDETDNDLVEALTFTRGVVEPEFTLEDYDRLQEKSVGALITIIKAINAASGLSDEAVAEATKSNGTGSEPAIRVLPSARVEDDAGGTAGADVLK